MRRVSEQPHWFRWRRRAGLLAFVSAFAAAGTMVPAAPATPLTPSQAPLPGSEFQGADGNQDNAAADRVDWQAKLVDDERVRHNPDPNAQDSAFVGDSKEGLPDQWAFTTEKNGVSPPKANVLDAWESIEQRGPDKFVYLAFARGGPGTLRERAASVFLTFELNHDGRLWTNDAGAQIPCRRTGDMLISYEAEGSDFEVIVQRWVTTSYDPATGCARAGHLEGYSGMTDGTDAQGAINDAAITNRLPGFYEEEGTVPRERFGESALNLTRILGAGFEDRCMAFSSIWMHRARRRRSRRACRTTWRRRRCRCARARRRA